MVDSKGQTLLEVKNLNVKFASKHVLKDFSMVLKQRETIAIIGETGSGKTMAISSILDLLNKQEATIDFDKMVYLEGRPLQELRAKEIAVVFQNAGLSLNPVRKCGDQIQRIIRKHSTINKNAATKRVIDLLHKVHIAQPERIARSFPHQVSGGELQRVMIAMSLACEPQILVLDEPASSLDKIVQKEIIMLLKELKEQRDIATLLISHDLEMVSELADHVIHLHKGQIIASQSASKFFTAPSSIISEKLIKQYQSFRKGNYSEPKSSIPIMKIENLSKLWTDDKLAFKDITFELREEENLGVIGESGSGKSSLAKCIAGIWEFDHGAIHTKIINEKVCYVFQDAYSAMDPDLDIKTILNEVIRLQDHKVDMVQLLRSVLLDEDILSRKIHQLSGGQRQRVNLARALACNPEVIICDEITSGLDLNIQFEIIELLKSFKELSIIFISHDISLVKYFCHRVLILRNGRMEIVGEVREIFEKSESGYISSLINSVPNVKYFLNT